jgi:hypothetical protein
MATSKRCKTCGHWGPEGKRTRGACFLIDEHGNANTARLHVYTEDDAMTVAVRLVTEAEFGCTEWATISKLKRKRK